VRRLFRRLPPERGRRLNHPLFKPFWEQGTSLLLGGSVGSSSSVKPLCSEVRQLKIAAAQMACSRDMHANVRRIRHEIIHAAEQEAGVAVFPELAVTGSRAEDIRTATQAALDDALE
jgi:hypothetical protein